MGKSKTSVWEWIVIFTAGIIICVGLGCAGWYVDRWFEWNFSSKQKVEKTIEDRVECIERRLDALEEKSW